MAQPTREEPRDCSGALDGALVSRRFWPACGNCEHKAECWESLTPRHPAFPHNWHWSVRGVDFPEGHNEKGERTGSTLVLESWVGISVYGAKHTGCYDYRVARRYTLPMMRKHARVLALWRRNRAIDATTEAVEDRYPDFDYPDDVAARYHAAEEERDRNEAEITRLLNLSEGEDIPT